MTIDEIRKKFPNPVAVPLMPGDYCVGGAVCISRGYEAPFPSEEELRHILQMEYGLDWITARGLAIRVIEANNACRFGDAWDALKEKLP